MKAFYCDQKEPPDMGSENKFGRSGGRSGAAALNRDAVMSSDPGLAYFITVMIPTTSNKM